MNLGLILPNVTRTKFNEFRLNLWVHMQDNVSHLQETTDISNRVDLIIRAGNPGAQTLLYQKFNWCLFS